MTTTTLKPPRRLPRRWLSRADAEHDAVLNLRRIFILPTRQGWLLALVLTLMLIGAINYSNSLAFGLTFLLLSAALVSTLHTYFNLAGLRIGVGATQPAFVGGHVDFTLRLAHDGRRARWGVTLRTPTGITAMADVAAGEGTHVILQYPAQRRGRITLGRVTVSCDYPLGLMRAWAYVECAQTALVYPAPSGDLPVPAAAGEDRLTMAGAGEDDFQALQPYRPGDSPRRVDWKAWARHERLLVRQFGHGGGRHRVLGWEATASLRDTELRLSQLCRWVLEAEHDGVDYALHLPGAQIALGRGEAQRHRCLAALALHGQGRNT